MDIPTENTLRPVMTWGGYRSYAELRAEFVRAKRRSRYEVSRDKAVVNENLTAMRGSLGVRAAAQRRPELLDAAMMEQRSASDWWRDSSLWRDSGDVGRPTEAQAIRNVKSEAESRYEYAPLMGDDKEKTKDYSR